MSTKPTRTDKKPPASKPSGKQSISQGKGRGAAKDNSRTLMIAVAVAIIVVVGAVAWFARGERSDQSVLEGRVLAFASEGSIHVRYGERVNYRSNPPHSGPHYDTPANPAFYRSQIPDEVVVHNLEHGHVVLYYMPGSLTQEDEDYVAALARTYTATWAAFLAVPRAEMDHPFVLAAWRHLMPLETLDRTLVEAFIDRFIGRGPENPVR